MQHGLINMQTTEWFIGRHFGIRCIQLRWARTLHETIWVFRSNDSNDIANELIRYWNRSQKLRHEHPPKLLFSFWFHGSDTWFDFQPGQSYYFIWAYHLSDTVTPGRFPKHSFSGSYQVGPLIPSIQPTTTATTASAESPTTPGTGESLSTTVWWLVGREFE